MLKERREAAQSVADRLMAFELALDKAVVEAASFVASMPQARVQANLAAEVGHEAIELGAAAFASLVQARAHLIASHRALAETKTRAGLREVALGGLMPKEGVLKPSALSVVRDVA